MRNFVLRYTLYSDFTIYLCRALLGFLMGYALYVAFPEYSVSWTIISIVLVISPDEKESKKIAIDRAKSNFIGSAVGLTLYFLPIAQLQALVIGIIISILVCKLLDILAVARTSMVALVIVFLHEQEIKSYFAALDRFGCVSIGCVIGLTVVLSTIRVINWLRLKFPIKQ